MNLKKDEFKVRFEGQSETLKDLKVFSSVSLEKPFFEFLDSYSSGINEFLRFKGI